MYSTDIIGSPARFCEIAQLYWNQLHSGSHPELFVKVVSVKCPKGTLLEAADVHVFAAMITRWSIRFGRNSSHVIVEHCNKQAVGEVRGNAEVNGHGDI